MSSSTDDASLSCSKVNGKSPKNGQNGAVGLATDLQKELMAMLNDEPKNNFDFDRAEQLIANCEEYMMKNQLQPTVNASPTQKHEESLGLPIAKKNSEKVFETPGSYKEQIEIAQVAPFDTEMNIETMFAELETADYDLSDGKNLKALKDYFGVRVVRDTAKLLIKVQRGFGGKAELEGKIKKLNEILQAKLKYTSPLECLSPLILSIDRYAQVYVAVAYGVALYLMGRWPNTWFYTYCCVAYPLIFLLRYFEFQPQKWEVMMLDFCYYLDFVTLYFVAFDPKNQFLFRACFVNGFGVLAIASYIFANPIVMSKSYYLASIAIHFMPMYIMYNLTQITIPGEAHKKESERVFCDYPVDEPFFSQEAMYYNFFAPFVVYMVWNLSWYFICVVFLDGCLGLNKHGYFNLYVWFSQGPPFEFLPRKFGNCLGPIMFQLMHLGLFFIGLIFGWIAYYSSYMQVAFLLYWTLMALLRGNEYSTKVLDYMKYQRIQSTIRHMFQLDRLKERKDQ